MLKKLKCGELVFVLGTVLSALGIALQTKADIGISMVAAPAYILSLKIPVLSFWHFGVFGSMRIIYTMLLYYKEICMENIMVIFSSNSLCWCTGLYNEHCQ
ncbi:MAG: hypothetical protein ACLR8P_23640 [Clostridium fessum]